MIHLWKELAADPYFIGSFLAWSNISIALATLAWLFGLLYGIFGPPRD